MVSPFLIMLLGVLPILPKKITCMLPDVMGMHLTMNHGYNCWVKMPGKLGDTTQHNEHGLDHSITLVTFRALHNTNDFLPPHNCV